MIFLHILNDFREHNIFLADDYRASAAHNCWPTTLYLAPLCRYRKSILNHSCTASTHSPRSSWLISTFHYDTDCPPNLQLLRGQELCSCGHKSVEQFVSWLKKCRVVVLPVQVVAEDVFISTVRPRRNCKLFFY